MAGWSTNQILRGMPDMLALAEASGTDLARTADIVSDGMTAFNLDLNKTPDAANRFANAMIAAATGSNTSVELMGETFKYAGAVAGSLGYEIEDVALATGLMANASIKGSMAGTALRSIFTRMIKPPKDAAAALNALGVSATTSDGKVLPLRTTLQNLRTAFKGLSDAEKAEYAANIAGQEAMAGFLAMMNASDFDFDKLLKRIKTAQEKNLLGETQDIMNDNLEDSFKSLGSAWEGLQIAIGDVFQEPLKNLVGNLAEGLGELVQFIDKHQELAKAAGIAAAAISAVIVGAAGYSMAAAGVEVLAASHAGLRAQAIGSAAAQRMAQFASMGWRDVGTAISGAFTGLLGKIAAARTAVVSFFTTAAATNGASIITSITNIGSAFLSAGRAAMSFVFSPVGIALMALAAAGYFVYTHWSQVAPVFQNLASVISGALSTAIQTLTPAFNSMSNSASRLGPAFSQIGGAVFSALAVVANVVVRVAALIITAFSNAVRTVIELFSGLGNAIASLLAGDFSKAGEHLSQTLSKTFDNVKKTFSDGFSGALDIGKNLTLPLDIMARQETIDNRRSQETQQLNSDIVKSLSIAIESLKGNEETSKISEAVAAAVAKVKEDPKADLAPLLEGISTAIESVKEENPDADVSKISEAVSASLEKISAAQGERDKSSEMIQAVSTAVESLKEKNSDADFSKIEAAISAAVEKSDSSEKLAAAISTAIESVKQEQPELDLTPIVDALQVKAEEKTVETETLQSAVDQTAESMEQFAPTMAEAAEGVNQMTAGQQMFNAEVQNSQATLSATNAQVQASQGALSGFNGALQSTNGGLTALASSSSSAAGAVSGLGSAAQAAVAALQSAGSQAAAAVNAAAANIGKPAANFSGGIYSKGAFLTTFAEKSPEAAIPIDKSQRAIDLWTKTGQMLGQLPGRSFATRQPPQGAGLSTLERAQRQRLEQVKAQYESAKKMSNGGFYSDRMKYDELGNIIGLDGLKDNVITKDDDLQVIRAKKEAQRKEWATKTNSTPIETPRKVPQSIFSGRVQTPQKVPQSIFSERVQTPRKVPQSIFSERVQTPRKVPQSIFSGRVQTPQKVPQSIFSGRVQTPQKVPQSIFSGRVQTPPTMPDLFRMTQTLPRTVDTINPGGILSAITDRISEVSSGGIFPTLLNNLPQNQPESSPIDLHFEINIAGNANSADVEQGIRQSIPLLEETFERKLANYRHEQQRRSFQ